jgi:cytochrome c oxidase subunit 1
MMSNNAAAGRDRNGAPTGWRRWLFSTNHKDIGTLYFGFAICAGLIGGLISLLIRFELTTPNFDFALFQESIPFFSAVVTIHGLTMVLFMVMPGLIGGFGNWFVPLMIGASDMAFPRINHISFWILPPAAGLLLASALYGDLSGAINMAILALLLVGASSVLGAINFVTTILNMRTPGLTLHTMPLFVWSILVAGFLLLLTVPILAGAMTVLMTGHTLQTSFLHVSEGGEPLHFQHLFWLFGHPEVYILIIPGFGIVSQVISTFSKRPHKGHLSMAYSMVTIGAVGFLGWAYQMYSGGMNVNAQAYFLAVVLIVTVPTGILIAGWIGTMWGGAIEFRTPLLFALAVIFLLVVGGVSAVALANADLNAAFHESFYRVGHFHYTLSIGAMFSLFAGFYYWIGTMSRRQYPERWGKLHFWVMFIGVNLTFFPMLLPLYPGDIGNWSRLSTLGAYFSFAGALIFLFVFYRTFAAGVACAENPWDDTAPPLERAAA